MHLCQDLFHVHLITIASMLQWVSSGQNVDMRGKSGSGDGVHVMTGPIYVCGAEPGDVLQIDILDLKPRPNPSTGKTYGPYIE
jgi:acetamidase/formamidase